MTKKRTRPTDDAAFEAMLVAEILAAKQKADLAAAAGYARALIETLKRYLDGFMAEATWKKHSASLWNRIEAEGLLDDVAKLLDSNNRIAGRRR